MSRFYDFVNSDVSHVVEFSLVEVANYTFYYSKAHTGYNTLKYQPSFAELRRRRIYFEFEFQNNCNIIYLYSMYYWLQCCQESKKQANSSENIEHIIAKAFEPYILFSCGIFFTNLMRPNPLV